MAGVFSDALSLAPAVFSDMLPNLSVPEAMTLEPLLDSVGEGLLVVDDDGVPQFWNAAAEKILGVATLSHGGTVWQSSVFPPDGVKPLAAKDRSIHRAMTGEPVTEQRFAFQSDRGNIQISSTARALAKDGHVYGAVAVFREVTEQHRVEAVFRDSKSLYRTLAQHLPSTVVLLFDRELRFILAEGGGLADAGLSSDQIEGRPVAEYATPSLLDRYAAVFDGVSTDVEVERSAGRRYRVQLAPVRDKHGNVTAGLMVASDLTEQTRREQERQTAEQLKVLAETIPQIVWTANPDGGIDYYNARWFEYTGMTLEQTRGWGWKPVLHPDDLDNCVTKWKDAVQSGNAYEVEYRFKRATDGAYRWHLGRALPIRTARGAISKWFGTCTDIEDQRAAQRALQDAQKDLEQRVAARTAELSSASQELQQRTEQRRISEVRFRAAMGAMLDALYIVESVRNDSGRIADFRIVELNDAASARLGRPREELIGRLQSELDDPTTFGVLLAAQAEVVDSGNALEREFKLHVEREQPSWVRQQLVPLGDGLLITVRNTSADKNHKELLELHQRDREQYVGRGLRRRCE